MNVNTEAKIWEGVVSNLKRVSHNIEVNEIDDSLYDYQPLNIDEDGSWLRKDFFYRLYRYFYILGKFKNQNVEKELLFISQSVFLLDNIEHIFLKFSEIDRFFDWLYVEISKNNFPKDYYEFEHKHFDHIVSIMLFLKNNGINSDFDYYGLNLELSVLFEKIEEVVKKISPYKLYKMVSLYIEANNGIKRPFWALFHKCNIFDLLEIGIVNKYIVRDIDCVYKSFYSSKNITIFRNYMKALSLWRLDSSRIYHLYCTEENYADAIYSSFIYELLYGASYYNEEYINFLVNNLACQLIKEYNYFGFTEKEYYNFIRYIMEQSKKKLYITRREVYHELNLDNRSINNLLEFFSTTIDRKLYMGKEITEIKVDKIILKKIDEELFFLNNFHFSGAEFYYRIKSHIVSIIGKEDANKFNSQLGERIEDLVKKMIKNKGITFLSGKYLIKGREEECDILIKDDNNDYNILIEIKSSDINYSVSEITYDYVIKQLLQGYIKALNQNLKHIKDILKFDGIKINDKKYTIKNLKRVKCVCLCFGETPYLSSQALLQTYIQLLKDGQIKGPDPKVVGLEKRLLDLRKKYESIHAEIIKIDKDYENKIHIIFMTFQEFFLMLNSVNSVNDLYTQLDVLEGIVYGDISNAFGREWGG